MITVAAILLALGALSFPLLVRRQDLPSPAPTSPTAHLEERRKVIYENLRDLQFEFRVGKLSEADYQEAKKNLQKELAEVTAQMERFQAAASKSAKAGSPDRTAAAVAKAGTPPAAPSESMVCPHCGAKFPQALKFCGECGRPMAGGTA